MRRFPVDETLITVVYPAEMDGPVRAVINVIWKRKPVMRARTAALTVSFVFVLVGMSHAQSLREAAERGSKPESTFSVDFPTLSVPEILVRSELVVHGKIDAVASRLAYDDMIVVTDYTITPLRFLKGDPYANKPAVPGPTKPLVVRCAGGTVVEGDTRFTTHVEAFPPSEAFVPGEQVILFLVYNAEIGVYQLTDGPYAAFRIGGGQVVPMTKKAAETRGDEPRPLATFLAELEQEIHKGR